MSLVKVNIDGRIWSLAGEAEPSTVAISPSMTTDEGEPVDGIVILGKTASEKSDYLLVDGAMRAMHTCFFYGLKDGQLYYEGDDPSQESDGMVFAAPYQKAVLIPEGSIFPAHAEFDTSSFTVKCRQAFGDMGVDEDSPDRSLNARELMELIQDPALVTLILLEVDDPEPQVSPDDPSADLTADTLYRRAKLVMQQRAKQLRGRSR